MQTHLIMRRLNRNERPEKDVMAMFAVNSSGRAVLFIHGFSGDALRTWSRFHELLPQRSKFRGRDIFFYGYDGLRADIYASAAIFREFLSRLFSKRFADENLPLSISRETGSEYKELIVVAHSLGAAIARRALLDATKAGCEWVGKIRLVLYAPAHAGASIVGLAQEAMAHIPFAGIFINYAKFKSPLIEQLKEGSDFLKSLSDETQSLMHIKGSSQLVALKVLIAEYENIVVNKTFCGDPPPVPIEGGTHTSLCKPRPGFLKPINALEDCI